MTSRLDELSALAARARAFHGGPWDRVQLGSILDAAGARSAGERLSPDACVAVVTGQQPALGGGPLYTLAKAAHAVALARDLSAGGQSAQAVFWCASEDHDLGEANHADLVGDDGALTRIASSLGGGRASLSHRSAAHGWDALQKALATRWPSAVGREFMPCAGASTRRGAGRLAVPAAARGLRRRARLRRGLEAAPAVGRGHARRDHRVARRGAGAPSQRSHAGRLAGRFRRARAGPGVR